MKNIYVCDEKKVYSFGKKSLYTVENVILTHERCDGIIFVKKDPVFYANISVTNNCNLSCKHCLANTTSRGHVFNEFSKNEIIDFVRQLHLQGLSNISITGGEPFLCKNIFIWLEELKRYSIDTKISTNGTLLDKAMVDSLVKYDNLTEMDISINGGLDDSEIFYSGGNSIPQKIKNVNYLLSKNKYSDIFMSSVLSKTVLYSLEEIEKIISKTMISTWKLKDIHIPYDKVELVPNEIIPTKAEVIEVLTQFLSQKHHLNIIGYLVDSIKSKTKPSRCENHGQRGFYISHTGEVLWMHSFDIKLGNLYKDSIPELAANLTDAIDANPVPIRCQKCASRFACFKSPYDIEV